MSLLRDDRVQIREAPFCARLIGLEGTLSMQAAAKLDGADTVKPGVRSAAQAPHVGVGVSKATAMPYGYAHTRDRTS